MKKPSIDGEDNNGNYTFENCRYVEQGINSIERNKRKAIKSIIQYDLEGNFIKEWNSIKEASNFYGFHVSTISKNLRLDNKTACGYIWRYK
jgi:hypothetical protein